MQPRTKVFISYSHKDAKWVERFRVHLKPLEREGAVERWDDAMLKPGLKWRDEIRKGIEAAKVAVLFVSADFLASDFIMTNELPPLMAAADEDGAVIIPVIVSPSRFEQTPELSRFQTLKENPPHKPLSNMSRSSQENVFVKLTEAIEAALHGDPVRSQSRAYMVLDSGHNLEKWDRGFLPRLHVDFKILRETASQKGYALVERNLGDFSSNNLQRAKHIIIVCPKDCHYTKAEIDHLVQFIRSGGSILVLAYYWWKSDHDTNIGELTAAFGIKLNDDRLSDPLNYSGNEYIPLCACTVPELTDKPVDVPLCCTLELGAQAEPILMSSGDARSETVRLEERRIVRKYEATATGPFPTAARARVGGGKVAVVGSWEVFLDKFVDQREHGNAEFLKGVLSWLTTD
ncbi:MAG TPA: toll/interleukin-1 receptor domain-containing protein [Pyrinomonadaceae bacterium]|nr:toll/interleukin-1 receptor domain-containing protein [Pyrinomonadaceae bacterium]